MSVSREGKVILDMVAVDKYFGGVHAIDNCNLQVLDREIHGLIGPNGAGKTTIFNNITGIYKPDTGHIYFCENEITGKQPHEVAKAGIARTFQNIRLFSSETALENVIMACNMSAEYGFADAVLHTPKYKRTTAHIREHALELLEIVGLADKKDEQSSSLPYGHQRKLEIARAMALNPKLLLLDEPAAGMNKEESIELCRFVTEIHEHFGIAILMIEHHIDVVANLCDTCTVLNFGETISTGTPEEVTKDPKVITAYLGGNEN